MSKYTCTRDNYQILITEKYGITDGVAPQEYGNIHWQKHHADDYLFPGMFQAV